MTAAPTAIAPSADRPAERHDRPPLCGPSLCVLASGSAGNCSILHIPGDGVWLIDLGLSPRRTRRALEAMGVAPEDIRGALITHLDHDHLHPGWARAWPEGVPLLVHRRHARSARAAAAARGRLRALDDEFEAGALRVRAILAPHDQLGASVFRIDFPPPAGAGADGAPAPFGALGYATDIGRCHPRIVDLLAGVDTLAIESNYCPRLQSSSGRPLRLRQRITGGAGHLSNQECLDAIRAIGPRQRVILLHLSRDCNHPATAGRLHHGAPYEVVITNQMRRTPWLPLRRVPPPSGGGAAPAPVATIAIRPAPPMRQLPLFAEAS